MKLEHELDLYLKELYGSNIPATQRRELRRIFGFASLKMLSYIKHILQNTPEDLPKEMVRLSKSSQDIIKGN